MSMRLLIKYTSRSRPDRFFFGLDSIVNNLMRPKDHQILCTFDTDDTSMNNAEVIAKLASYHDYNITWVFGESTSKISAINSDIDKADSDWDILVNMSDDMEFTERGFDQFICYEMEKHFPDTDGVLHFPDGYTNERLITMSIIGRKYFERFGYIYHPDYKSLWCDNEFTELAKRNNKYAYIPQHIFTHNHPAWGKVETDEQYRHTESFNSEDHATFKRRKKAGFP
jgi:hypothetical protein